MIVALAGHVDHGKTALIRALTGIDADRLPEERRRGMTIDLGFAYSRLPDGTPIGFVDVPGHERFIANMLSGVLAIRNALLVIAADDGVMPQTREHLDVLRLTGVPGLIAAITKIDRVDQARRGEVVRSVRTFLDAARYPNAPVLAVSSHTREGLAALSAALSAAADPVRPDGAGRGFRLAIDRAFVLAGIGLVVTGTVAAGAVEAGDALMLTPARLGARVRGIHVGNAPAKRAAEGERCALAIAGPRLERGRVTRGDWLVRPDLHAPITRLDASVRTTEGRGLRHGAPAHAHLGAGEALARVLTLGAGDLAAGSEGFIHLVLDRPVAALHGDQLVLRDADAGRVVAGGRVIDPFPPTRRGSPFARLSRLAAQAEMHAPTALARLLAAEGAVDLRRFGLARNVAPVAPPPGAVLAGEVALSATMHATLRARLLAALAEFHAAQPDVAGPNKPVLLARSAVSAPIGEAVLADLLAEGTVLREGAALRLAGYHATLGSDDEALWRRLRPLLTTAELRPPRVRELAEALNIELDRLEPALRRLERFGRVLRIAPNRVFLPETVERLAAIARDLAAVPPDYAFSAAVYNTATGLGRNLAIQVLEHLDGAGCTRRIGDLRCAVDPS